MNTKKKVVSMTHKDKQAYDDLLVGRAIRIASTGKFIPLEVAIESWKKNAI